MIGADRQRLVEEEDKLQTVERGTTSLRLLVSLQHNCSINQCCLLRHRLVCQGVLADQDFVI